jgi:hypothetical protein
VQNLRTGARLPFFCTDITYYRVLGLGDFSPIEDVPDTFSASEDDLYIKSGFLVSNASDTAGCIYCVTWEEFQMHRSRSNRDLVTNLAVLALCTPISVYVASGKWLETPVVKVFSTYDKYMTEISHINVGTIR